MINDYKTAISPQRFDSFRQPGFDDRQTLTNYLWNMCLSESFYPLLQTFEIGLRNAIHNSLTFINRNSLWFKQNFMYPKCLEGVQAAEDELREKGKDHTDVGRIIAELKFGFWTRLFNRHYQQPLWNNKTFLLRTFPNANAKDRLRHLMAVEVDEIRRFRNRVFHHESIISRKIQEMHDKILKILSWINPVLADSVKIIDCVPAIYTNDYFDNLIEEMTGPKFQIRISSFYKRWMNRSD